MTTAALAPPPGVLVTKLQPPAARDQSVERQRLLDLLEPQPGVKLIVLAAPEAPGMARARCSACGRTARHPAGRSPG